MFKSLGKIVGAVLLVTVLIYINKITDGGIIALIEMLADAIKSTDSSGK